MAYTPIQRTLPQYVDTNGDPYSGAVLKAYTAGTSTNISFATDSTGGTLIATVALNANGYPENAGTQIIPHLNENYKLALYPTQAAADSDTGAIWTIDNIILATADFSDNEVTNVGNGTARDSATNVGQVQDSQFISLGTTAGAADAYTLTPSVPITAYVDTQFFIAQIHATNSTTTPYLQISGIADPATNAVIKKLDATRAEIAVEASDLLINGIYMFKRNSTNDAWIVLNPERLPVLNINNVILTSGGELTIATGAVTITNSNHTIDTESDASTDDLDTINGGTTGQILTIGSAADARDVVIKHGTGNIICPDGVDITLGVTNDKAILFYDGTNWIITSYSVASDIRVDKVLISTVTASNDATIDFESLLTSDYLNYEVEITNMLPASDEALKARFGIGSSYASSSYAGGSVNGSKVDGPTGGTSATSEMDCSYDDAGWFIESTSTKGYNGKVTIYNPSSTTTHKQIQVQGTYDNASGNHAYTFRSNSYEGATTAQTSIQFFMGSGNITSGTFKLYGLK